MYNGCKWHDEEGDFCKKEDCCCGYSKSSAEECDWFNPTHMDADDIGDIKYHEAKEDGKI